MILGSWSEEDSGFPSLRPNLYFSDKWYNKMEAVSEKKKELIPEYSGGCYSSEH